MNRRGTTLIELLVSMVVMGMVGAATLRLILTQTRGAEKAAQVEEKRESWRVIHRVLLDDLREIEPAGISYASSQLFIFRRPFAAGIVCGPTGGGTVVSFLPEDSVASDIIPFDGVAWRDDRGGYHYVDGSTRGSVSETECDDAGITTPPGGRVAVVTPPLPTVAKVGTPVLSYERLRFMFTADGSNTSARALWRENITTSERALVARGLPPTTRFRFFVAGSNFATSYPPALFSSLRGLEVNADLADRNASLSRAATVFFGNRPDR